jgi:hypothetical protein
MCKALPIARLCASAIRLEGGKVCLSASVIWEVAVATALYHRFLERIVARVPVAALLQRRYTVRDNVHEYADKA